MKKFFLAILIALFSVTALGVSPFEAQTVYAQKKDEDKKKDKKDPPGPPVVREKDKEKPKNDKPKKDKKPD
jgi:uncharacterized alpha/beta hydrolase family protein